MTAERTALESRLIPVSAYILVSAAEAWYRWPDMMTAIDKVMPAAEIGAAGRRPGMRVNASVTSSSPPVARAAASWRSAASQRTSSVMW